MTSQDDNTRLHFVFDAFPSPEGARFIELEDDTKHSIAYGEWLERADGHVELVVPDHRPLLARALERLGGVYDPQDDSLHALRDEIRKAIGAA